MTKKTTKKTSSKKVSHYHIKTDDNRLIGKFESEKQAKDALKSYKEKVGKDSKAKLVTV